MQATERTAYHDIVVECYSSFVKDRPEQEFSDEWWKNLIADFDKICKKREGTEYHGLAMELSMRLLEQHERRQKKWKATAH